MRGEFDQVVKETFLLSGAQKDWGSSELKVWYKLTISGNRISNEVIIDKNQMRSSWPDFINCDLYGYFVHKYLL